MDASERASHERRPDRYAVPSFLSSFPSFLYYPRTPPIVTHVYRSSRGAGRARTRNEVGARAILPSPTDASPGIEARVLTAPSWPRCRVGTLSSSRIASPRIAQVQHLLLSLLPLPLPLSLSLSLFRTMLCAVRCIIFNLLSRSFDAWRRRRRRRRTDRVHLENMGRGKIEIETQVFLFSLSLSLFPSRR